MGVFPWKHPLTIFRWRGRMDCWVFFQWRIFLGDMPLVFEVKKNIERNVAEPVLVQWAYLTGFLCLFFWEMQKVVWFECHLHRFYGSNTSSPPANRGTSPGVNVRVWASMSEHEWVWRSSCFRSSISISSQSSNHEESFLMQHCFLFVLREEI